VGTTQAWRQAARLSQVAAATVGLFTLLGVAPADAGPITLIASAQSTPNESCSGGTPVTQTSSTLAVAHYACTAGPSVVGADASAAPGVLGVASTGQHAGGSIPLAQFGQTEYSDVIAFAKLDPSLPDTFAVSLTFELEGTLARTSGGAAALTGNVSMDNLFIGTFEINMDLPFRAPGFTVTGTTGPNTVDAQLTTTTGIATVGQLYGIHMTMWGQTYVTFGGSATIDFLHTFGFPSDRPVFNLPDGYTANAGNYLVNNRLVGAAPVASEVPEPGTLTLVGMSIAGLVVRRSVSGGGWLARRR